MFRVTVRGKFDGLTEADRTALKATRDPFQAAFTPEGTFSYDTSVSAFTFRCQVPAAAEEDGEAEATAGALAALDAHGLPYQVLKVAVTDMRTVRIRRKGR
ncbi:DUF6204 family protein [Streptomyces sp. NPDC059740]|uniref:DUF6204 family protein n=1 Tax=Streptomyces sp. NPDC059740 TaxID=3346926 RepID=UPI00366A2496